VLNVHTIDCPTLAKHESDEEAWRDLSWSNEAERNAIGTARVKATIKHAAGVLGEACTIIGEAGGNIANLMMHHRQQDFFDVDFDIDVKDARHLTTIIAALRANPSVDTVDRALGVRD
jgi:GTP pyrophosphokinase/guanosine-3',5'-bis(diphosphate) 3'-pyrophosphohydrolase